MQTLRIIILLCILFCGSVSDTHAQEVHSDLKETVAAEVLSVSTPETHTVPGTDITVTTETVSVRMLEGETTDQVRTFENEHASLTPGQKIFVNRVKTIAGDEYIVLMDIDRRSKLAWLAGGAVLLVLLFAGWHGARALFSLGLSIAAIIFILIPSLLAGYNPAIMSVLIAAVILAAVLFITHGINPRSIIAFGGTMGAVSITGGIALVSVHTLQLSGFNSDAAVFLNIATNGSLDLAGLLLGSIIIGILGVLDDVSITQASVVQELKAANNSLDRFELYRRAINVGRDHIGSLVNTLALAYVGVSLPLILLYARADSTLSLTLNQEIVSAEIVRIIIGSIGLVLAVPLTTLLAAWYFGGKKTVATPPDHGHHHAVQE